MSSLDEAVAAIRRVRPRRTVVLTGAGISAESGIPTFRGAGGLWKNFKPEELATPQAFRRDPALVWEWYEWRRDLVREASPNAAHHAIARLGAPVVTQNVDGLHARAGADPLFELHGNIFRVRCTREGIVTDRQERFESLPPHCSSCGALLRPHIVWFGETLDDSVVQSAVSAIRHADAMLVIGTSGVVYPAAGFVTLHRGLSIEINPEASAVSSACSFAVAERATIATPPIVDALLEVQDGGPDR